jgi:hypothetical protein
MKVAKSKLKSGNKTCNDTPLYHAYNPHVLDSQENAFGFNECQKKVQRQCCNQEANQKLIDIDLSLPLPTYPRIMIPEKSEKIMNFKTRLLSCRLNFLILTERNMAAAIERHALMICTPSHNP